VSSPLHPPPDLDRLAGVYRWMELLTFGPFLARCRFAFLAQMTGSRRALILGDGDGRFTARLLRVNPCVIVDAVDASPAMLRALIRRAGPQADRVRAHCADVRLLPAPNAPYDLIVTHFFLDFLTGSEVQSLAAKLRDAVSPSALWVVSEFVIPDSLFGRVIARPVVAGLYLGFRWLSGLAVRTLPDHPNALRAAGFTLHSRRTLLAGLLSAELWCAGNSGAIPGLLCPVQNHPRSPLPDGRVDLSVASSGYTDPDFAVSA